MQVRVRPSIFSCSEVSSGGVMDGCFTEATVNF